MADTTLLFSVLLGFMTGGVYIATGARVHARELQGEARTANRMFAAWWWALGGITALTASVSLLAFFGITDLSIHIAVTVATIFVLCVSLWALGHYLLYLFTGRGWILTPLGLFYAGYFSLLMVLVWRAHPIGVDVSHWTTSLTYESPLLPGGSTSWLLLLLIAPQLLGGIAYFSLYFRVDERAQKYRIALVGGTIVIWFGSALAGSAFGWSEAAWWPLVSRLLGLGAATIIYLAFRPPRWMQRRYGLQPVSVVLSAPIGEPDADMPRSPYSAPIHAALWTRSGPPTS